MLTYTRNQMACLTPVPSSSHASPYHTLSLKHELSFSPSPLDDATIQQCVKDIYAINQQISEITKRFHQLFGSPTTTPHTTTRTTLSSHESTNHIIKQLHLYQHHLINQFKHYYNQYIQLRHHFVIHLDTTHTVCLRSEEHYTVLHRIYESLIELHSFIESTNNDEIYIEYNEQQSQKDTMESKVEQYECGDVQLSVDTQHDITSSYVYFTIHTSTGLSHDIHVIDLIRVHTHHYGSDHMNDLEQSSIHECEERLPIRMILNTTLKPHEEMKYVFVKSESFVDHLFFVAIVTGYASLWEPGIRYTK